MKKLEITNRLFYLVFSLIFLASLNWSLLAALPQEAQPREKEKKELKREVIKLQYVEAEAMGRLLVPFWGPDTRASTDRKSNVLIISDTPENLSKMLEVIRKIDVKPKDVVFTVQLIIASEGDKPTDPELKNDPLIKELQKLLRFGSYQLLDAAMVRAIDRQKAMTSFGPNNQFDITLKPEVTDNQSQENIKLNVTLRQVKSEKMMASSNEKFWEPTNPIYLIDSTLNLKSGERAVVGVSRMNEHSASETNKGLILIISGKIVS